MRPSKVFPILLLTASGLLAGCPAPPPSPSPTPSLAPCPSPCARPNVKRWGMIVLYEDAGQCTRLAGPPLIGAYAGDEIVWRVYNRCRRKAKVTITDVRSGGYAQEPPEAFSDAQLAQAEAPRKEMKASPILEGTPELATEAGLGGNLALRVRKNAPPGVYTYLVVIDGKADADQMIEIWP